MITNNEKYGFKASCKDADKILIRKESSRITEFDFFFASKEKVGKNTKIEIEYSFPARNLTGMWHPSCGTNRTIQADWNDGIQSMLSNSAPVVCFFDNANKNVHTYALSEVQQMVASFYGIHEENGQIYCRIVLNHQIRLEERQYQIKIWESTENEPYWDTLQKVRYFWENAEDYKIMNVPESARLPLYSFWYAMHQNVDSEKIEKESKLAADMGFSTIIVDDGWQTDDNHRGYAYCGDWKPSETKFPDFLAHVKKVQSFGIRYMLWFSVPFVGKKAGCFSEFKNMLLTFDEKNQAGVLDIRYPKVRQYLLDTYVRAVRDWGIDGLKLDFIDEFYLREDSPKMSVGMDYSDVQEALKCLLADISSTLHNINSEILIEFRQKYIGPEVCKYGNMLRVVDCPGSYLSNRIGIADIRLLSGNQAVHSDMLMWYPNETAKNTALQLISCLFGTVQISVLLESLDEEKRAVLLYWTTFMKEHRILLQESSFEPSQPQNLYPFIHACSEKVGEEIMVSYSENHALSLTEVTQPSFYYVHAGGSGSILIEGHSEKKMEYRVLDCMGNEIKCGQALPNTIFKIWMDDASMLCVKG